MLLGIAVADSAAEAVVNPRRVLKKLAISARGPKTIAGRTINAASRARDSTSTNLRRIPASHSRSHEGKAVAGSHSRDACRTSIAMPD